MTQETGPEQGGDLLDRQFNLAEVLFDRLPMGVAILDRHLVLHRCNATWADFIARSTKTPADRVVPGARFLDLAPGSETTTMERYARVLDGQTVREDGVPMESNGIITYWDVFLAPIWRADRVVGIVDVTASAGERVQAMAEARAQRDRLGQLIAERTAALRRTNEELVAEVAERRRTELALREEQAFSTAVLDTAGALVIVLDREGRIVRFNRACERLTGYTFAEVEGRPFWESLLVPKEVEYVRSVFNDLLEGKTDTGGEARWVAKSGTVKSVVWSNAVLAGPEGRVRFVIGTGIDITERKAAEEALRASEENYRDLVQNANSIILRMDTEGRITFFNEFAQRFFGFSEAEVLGQNIVGTIVAPSATDGADLVAMMADIGRHPERYATNENENVRKNGERVWVAWTNRAVVDAEGHTRELLCVGNDITERRRAAEALRQAHEELEQRVEERTAALKLANAELKQEIAERRRAEEALRERVAFENLLMTISTTFINLAPEEVDQGVGNALQAIGESAGVDRSYVFVYDDDRTTATNTHEWCAPGIAPAIQDLQALPTASTPMWTAAHFAGEAIHIPVVGDLPEAWSAERQILEAQGIRSVVSVPLLYRGKVVGFLGFDSVRAHKTWSEETINLLRIVGEIFVNAFERVRAARELQKAYQTLEERVADRTRELYTLLAVQQAISSRLDPDDMLQIVADEARRLTSSRMAVVFLVESESALRIAVVSGEIDRSLLGTTVPMEGSLAGLAMRTGKPQLSNEGLSDPRAYLSITRQTGARTILMVPLVYGDRAIGGIALANKDAAAFGPEDERRLMMLASGAAIDLENARLYHEEQERRQEAEQRRKVAEGLRDILAILNSNRPLDEVLEYIVAQACRLMAADAGALFRLQPDKRLLTIQAAKGLSAEYVALMSVPPGRGAVGAAVVKRRPVPVEDLETELRRYPDLFAGERARLLDEMIARFGSMLAVPLVVKDEVYGGIVLYYATKRVFGEEEIGLAVAFGDQAALALENARLRAQAEEAAVAAERSRLARDLHDAVTQTLFSSSLIAEVLPRLWERNEAEGRRRLEELRQLTRGALAEMRTLLLELRPSALTETALPDLLRQLAEALTGRARVPASLEVRGERPLPADVQIALYRIAQEALNNVAKHAGATRATIELAHEPTGVSLSVADDGRGFEPGRAGPDHLGLEIMRERAASIGASLAITSEPGHGTRIVAVWREDVTANADPSRA